MEGFGTGIQYFALIMARIWALLFTMPVLNSNNISFQMRSVLALLITSILFTPVINFLPPLPNTPGGFVVAIMGQVFVGALIGYMISAIFAAFQLAGEIFSIQVGLSFSEVLDPQSEISIPILGTLKNTIGLLLFLTVDFQMDGFYVPAFLHMIRALGNSFRFVPGLLPDERIAGGILTYLDGIFGAIFLTALKIGIPVMGILFITSVALGLVGRVAPQMNLMNMGIQINITVGIFILIVLTPVIIPIMEDSFYMVFDRVGEMVRGWNHMEQHARLMEAVP